MTRGPIHRRVTTLCVLCCASLTVACSYDEQSPRVSVRASQLSLADAAPETSAPVTVTLTFDDQRVSQSIVREALRSAGRLKGTFFVISSYVNDAPGDPPDYHPGKLSLEQLLDLEQDGHEIGAHTRTHSDLPTLSSEQLSDEICGSLSELRSYGLGAEQPIVSFAYPFGAYDDGVEAAVEKCGFTSARSVQAGPEHIPAKDAYATRTGPKGGSITKDDSVETIQGWIDGADAGDWLQLIWHDIASPEYEPRDEYYQTREDFIEVLHFLAEEAAQGRIAVKTVAQVTRDSSPETSP
ncbi:MAG TPA: polysaccharide deacetylase family protein [Polyangiales bacterium]|nr:polysaccharide deacetylase family protein [Polyangiales bacterium]